MTFLLNIMFRTHSDQIIPWLETISIILSAEICHLYILFTSHFTFHFAKSDFLRSFTSLSISYKTSNMDAVHHCAKLLIKVSIKSENNVLHASLNLSFREAQESHFTWILWGFFWNFVNFDRIWWFLRKFCNFNNHKISPQKLPKSVKNHEMFVIITKIS